MGVNALIFTELMDYTVASRPAGAYRIATELRKHGYTTQVVDYFTTFSEEECKNLIDLYVGPETLMLGFSSSFFSYVDEELNEYNKTLPNLTRTTGGTIKNMLPTINFPWHPKRMKRLFDYAKSKSPKLKIVLGGGKAQYRSHPHVDVFALGYGDKTVIELMKHLSGKNPFFQYEVINGFQWVLPNKTFEEFNTSTIEWVDEDHLVHGETLPIEISRGCVFKCKFCAFPLNGKKGRDHIKESSVLRDELLRNYDKWGTTNYIYVDDTHNDSVEKLEVLHEIVTSLPFKIEYAAYLRHDLIHAHPHTIKLLHESGLRSAIFGIETLNHESGKAIGKGLHPEKIKDLLYKLDEEWPDVAMSSGFIIGLPHETPETVEKWVPWVVDQKCPLDHFIFEGLFLSKGDKKIWVSEFEKEHNKYGYEIQHYGEWSNGIWTRKTAAALAADIQQKAIDSGRTKVGGFHFMMLKNYGLTNEQLLHKQGRTLSRKWLYGLRDQYVEGYKKALLKL